MSAALFSEPASHLDLLNEILKPLNGPFGLGGLATPRVAYRRDLAPQSDGDYAILDVLRTAGGNGRLGGGIAPSSWYATVVAVGSSVANASVLLRRSTLALTEAVVAVDGIESTPIGHRSDMDRAIEQDDDDLSLWVGSRTFSFSF